MIMEWYFYLFRWRQRVYCEGYQGISNEEIDIRSTTEREFSFPHTDEEKNTVP